MTCALAWVAGPDLPPPERHFRYVVSLDRLQKAQIERRARAANLSPDRYVQQLVDDHLLHGKATGAPEQKEARAPVTRATIASFAKRYVVSMEMAQLFAAMEATAVDGEIAFDRHELAPLAGLSTHSVLVAARRLEDSGLIRKVGMEGIKRRFRLLAEMR